MIFMNRNFDVLVAFTLIIRMSTFFVPGATAAAVSFPNSNSLTYGDQPGFSLINFEVDNVKLSRKRNRRRSRQPGMSGFSIYNHGHSENGQNRSPRRLKNSDDLYQNSKAFKIIKNRVEARGESMKNHAKPKELSALDKFLSLFSFIGEESSLGKVQEDQRAARERSSMRLKKIM